MWVHLQNAVVDADKVYMAAIDKFDATEGRGR